MDVCRTYAGGYQIGWGKEPNSAREIRGIGERGFADSRNGTICGGIGPKNKETWLGLQGWGINGLRLRRVRSILLLPI